MAVKKKSVKQSSSTSKSDNGVICAVLSYFLIGIIWFFVDETMKKNNFVKFHVKQSLVLLAVWVVLMVIAMFPFIGWLISSVLGLCLFVLAVIGIIYAAQGKSQAVPIVGQFADKLKF